MSDPFLLITLLVVSALALLLAERAAQHAKTIRFQRTVIDRQKARIDKLAARLEGLGLRP